MRNMRQRARKKLSPTLPQLGSAADPDVNSLRSPRRRKRRRLFLKIVVVCVVVVYHECCVWIFRGNSIRGGRFGMFIDKEITRFLWKKKLESARKAAEDWGLEIAPRNKANKDGKYVPYTVVLELLRRSLRRKNLLQGLEQNQRNDEESGNAWRIPKILLRQQDVWSRPISTQTGFVALDLDESEMNSYMQKNEESETIYSFKKMSRIQRGEFFFISFLSRHGGVYSTPFANHNDIELLLAQINSVESTPNELKKGWASIKNGILQSLILPPRNKFIACIKDAMKKSSTSLSSFQVIENELLSNDSRWIKNSNGFGALPQKCIGVVKKQKSDDDIHESSQEGYSRYMDMRVKKISVSITAKNEPKPEYHPKTTIEDLLLKRSIFCRNSWLWPCHRCLNSALSGTYAKCSIFCRSYSEFMYAKETNKTDGNIVSVDVDITGYQVDGKTQMIPRVVHQTWFEDITPLHYPHLIRLQNSWKKSGWDYKFYTDASARKYIEDHFPAHFLDAYDTLIPGAYKADLFRYMLLMREGGVYADIDVLLDTSLDTFITPTLTFFAPRDSVAEYADGQFCLWNGIIGAAPGHKIIVRAVESVVNLILNRADLFDLEKDVAQSVGKETEVWKLRHDSVPLLQLSGPCRLGIAANEMLGNKPLAQFDVGWQNSMNGMGDVMILMVSDNSFFKFIYIKYVLKCECA